MRGPNRVLAIVAMAALLVLGLQSVWPRKQDALREPPPPAPLTVIPTLTPTASPSITLEVPRQAELQPIMPHDRKECTPPLIPIPHEEPAKPVPLKWRLLGSWHGDGMTSTEPFVVRNVPWVLSYSVEPTNDNKPVLLAIVHGSDGGIAGVGTMVESAGVGRSMVYETGTCYLELSGANCRWTVAVYAQE
jgi:hypothetical protein